MKSFLPHLKETRRVAADRNHSAVEGYSHAEEEESRLVRDFVGGRNKNMVSENLLRGFLLSYVLPEMSLNKHC